MAQSILPSRQICQSCFSLFNYFDYTLKLPSHALQLLQDRSATDPHFLCDQVE